MGLRCVQVAMRTVHLASGVVLLLLATGCAGTGGNRAGEGGDPAGGDSDRADVADEFDRRAAEVASAWFSSEASSIWHTGFLPLEPLTVAPDLPDTDEAAQAIAAGWLRTDLDLPSETPDDGEIVFDDGESEPVPLVSLAQAWDAIYGGEPTCPDEPREPAPTGTGPDAAVDNPAPCTVLTVTDAYAGTVTVETSRGPAEVPAWLFDIEELDEPVARVAVAPEAVADPPRLDEIDFEHYEGLATAMHLVSIDGAELTYGVGVGACDLPPEPLVYEDTDAVVVGSTAIMEPGTTACTEQLLFEEVTVVLDEPLGERPVLATTGEVLTFGRW